MLRDTTITFFFLVFFKYPMSGKDVTNSTKITKTCLSRSLHRAFPGIREDLIKLLGRQTHGLFCHGNNLGLGEDDNY